MKGSWICLTLFVTSIDPSFQRCTSTIAATECDAIPFTRGQPIKLSSYKSLLQFKHGTAITEIPKGTFRSLPEVLTLYLSFNTIRNIESGSFEGLNKLNKLVLYKNSLEVIPNGAFKGCNNLVSLDLGANKIITIEKDAFGELANLQELVLSFNQLESVPKSLSTLEKIKKIDLSNNKIKSIELGIFLGLNALENLNLESNKIQHVPNDAFKGLGKLGEINLKDNYLSDLNVPNLISNLQSLKTIKLNINDFSCVALQGVVSQLEVKKIQVVQGVSKSSSTINGIACKLQ